MDLRDFYLKNVKEDEYYHKFYGYIADINKIYNIFYGYEEKEENEFVIYDIQEAIEKYKELCQPEYDKGFSKEDKCWFYLVSFFLYKNGYYIEQFPNAIKRPPSDPFDFVNKQIRNRAFSLQMNVNDTIPYQVRRRIIDEFKFNKQSSTIDIGEPIEEIFRKISTRNASFEEMAINEKLKEIANLIENLLKVNGKYLLLEYDKIAFEYINDEQIKLYRNRVQCFRHSANDSIMERENYTDEQKNFLVDYGILIIKTIYELKGRSVNEQ